LPIKIDYQFPATVTWIQPVTLHDVGGGGLGFQNDSSIRKNTRLSLRLHLAGRVNPINLEAKVSWCKKKGPGLYTIGVKFSRMEPRDRQNFISLLSDKILLSSLS
jgi:Tfp pilus assembly protein PilZ